MLAELDRRRKVQREIQEQALVRRLQLDRLELRTRYAQKLGMDIKQFAELLDTMRDYFEEWEDIY